MHVRLKYSLKEMYEKFSYISWDESCVDFQSEDLSMMTVLEYIALSNHDIYCVGDFEPDVNGYVVVKITIKDGDESYIARERIPFLFLEEVVDDEWLSQSNNDLESLC